MAAGAVAEDFQVAFGEIILPVLRQFEPDLLLISAGFDAHANDPLGEMRLTSDAFGAMTMELRTVAEQFSRGRLVAVTEGGYDLPALASSLDLVIETLNGQPGPARWPSTGVVSRRGHDAVRSAREALSPFWRLE